MISDKWNEQKRFKEENQNTNYFEKPLEHRTKRNKVCI